MAMQKLTLPPTSHFLLAAAGIADGSARAGPAEPPVGAVSLKHIYEIAKARLYAAALRTFSVPRLPIQLRKCMLQPRVALDLACT